MGGGTTSYREVEETDVLLLWGSNARETHPIFFHHVLKGLRRGTRMFVVDPRRTTSADWADTWVGLHVGTDIALANGLAPIIHRHCLEHRAYIPRPTQQADRLPVRHRPGGAREVRAGVGRDHPAGAGLAPVRHVRGDGARRAARAARDRREPGPLRGRRRARQPPPGRARPPDRAG